LGSGDRADEDGAQSPTISTSNAGDLGHTLMIGPRAKRSFRTVNTGIKTGQAPV
jgi:hypothetical protein